MFKLFDREPKFVPNRFDTVIAAGCSFDGVLMYRGTLLIKGQVRGDVVPKKIDADSAALSVIVDKNAYLQTPVVEADFVIVRGEIKGDVIAKRKLVVENDGIVTGTVQYGSLNIIGNGTVTGHISPIKTKSKKIDSAKEADVGATPALVQAS